MAGTLLLLKDSSKLQAKVNWLMTLVTHAAPTLYGELEGNYQATGTDANLIAATTAAYAPLVASEVQGYIEDFME